MHWTSDTENSEIKLWLGTQKLISIFYQQLIKDSVNLHCYQVSHNLSCFCSNFVCLQSVDDKRPNYACNVDISVPFHTVKLTNKYPLTT